MSHSIDQGFRFGPPGRAPNATRLADAVRAAAEPLELDASTLAARAVFEAPIPWSRTPYRGIVAAFVPARPDQGDGSDPAASPASVAEARVQLRGVLEKAVEDALGDARRAAVLAGGGVDSSALLALALRCARQRGTTVFGVALDFGGDGDDRPHLAAVERHLGCEVMRVKPEDAVPRFGLFRHGVDAAPFTWPAGPMEVEALARAREHGAELVLSGVGADEIFDGAPSALAEVARRRPLDAARRARSLRGFSTPRSPFFSWIVRPQISRWVSTYAPAALQRRRSVRLAERAFPAFAGPVLRDVLRDAARSRVAPPEATVPSPWDAPHLEPVAWLRHQEALAAGIEYRQPFLEPGLRAWAGALDPAWLLDGDVRRGLFREAVRDLLPRSVVERTDKALFETAHWQFLAASGGAAALRDLATVDELAALGIVLPRPFASAFAKFASGPHDGMEFTTLWPVLAVEAFVRSFRAGRDGRSTTGEAA